MKLTFKKKKKNRERERDDEEEKPSSSMGSKSWMIRGREKLVKEQRRADAMAKRSRRPPEVWIKDGESKPLRIRESEPIGIYQYSLRVNGKWNSVTMPEPGEKDLFKRAGMTPQLKYVYEVIDRKGYTDKKTGKRMRNLVRFLKVSGRLEKQLDKIRSKRGGLTKFDIELSRTGAGTDTTYTIIPEDREPLPSDVKALPRLTKEFEQYYAPPTYDEQRVMLAGVAAADSDDVDDDDEDDD